jgi:hypothetical protein
MTPEEYLNNLEGKGSVAQKPPSEFTPEEYVNSLEGRQKNTPAKIDTKNQSPEQYLNSLKKEPSDSNMWESVKSFGNALWKVPVAATGSIPGQIAGGYSGMAAGLGRISSGGNIDESLASAQEASEKTSNWLSEQLNLTKTEKESLELIGWPFEKLLNIADWVASNILIKPTMGLAAGAGMASTGANWDKVKQAIIEGSGDRTIGEPIIAAILKTWALAEAPRLARKAVGVPIRLEEIRYRAKAWEDWRKGGSKPLEQPRVLSEIPELSKTPPLAEVGKSKKEQAAKTSAVTKNIKQTPEDYLNELDKRQEEETTNIISEKNPQGLRLANMEDGKIYVGELGETHADIIERTGTSYGGTITGFVDKSGKFIRQTESAELKRLLGQGKPEEQPLAGEKGVGARGIKSKRETPTDITQLNKALDGVVSPKIPLRKRMSNAVSLADRFSNFKDSLNRGITELNILGRTLWNDAKSGEIGKPKYTDFDRIRDEYIGSYQITSFEAKQFAANIRKQISDPKRREAIINYLQADGDDGLLMRQHQEHLANNKAKQYADGYKLATELTPEEKIWAGNVAQYFDAKLQIAKDSGMLKAGIDNYIPQMWKKDNAISTALKGDIIGGKLTTKPSMLRKRILSSYFEGERVGLKPLNKDIGAMITAYDQAFNRAIAARTFIKSLHDLDMKDGSPAFVPMGSGKYRSWVKEDETMGSGYFVKPRSIPDEAYDNYKIIDHPALRKWKWVSKDADGQPIFTQADMLVHKDIYKKLNNILKTSAIRQNSFGRAVLQTAATLKGTLLSLSGFHQVQVGVHAMFHKVNPFGMDILGWKRTGKIDFSDPLQEALVKKGLIVSDYKNMELFHEGLTSGGLIAKIPGIGKVTQMYTDYLFTDYIPRLKMSMAKEAYARNTKRYAGKLTDEQIMSLTADQSNAAFGELNYAKLARNPTIQDVFRLIGLAPDFLEARIRFAGQAMRPYGGIPKKLSDLTPNEQAMAAVVRGALGMYVTARIANSLLNNGDAKWGADKAFSVVWGDEEFTLRSVPGDVMHLVTDPQGFAYNRLSPFLALPIIKALSRRDEFGRYMDLQDQVNSFAATSVPIPFQTKNERKIWEQVLASMGVNAFKTRTTFERALMWEHSKAVVTTMPREERDRYNLVTKLARQKREAIKEHDIDKYNDADKKVNQALIDNKLYGEDVQKIEKYAKEDMVEKYISDNRMDLRSIFKVWDKATSDEKMYYFPILEKRMGLLEKSHPEKYKEMLPFYLDAIKGYEFLLTRNQTQPKQSETEPEIPNSPVKEIGE